MTGLRDELHRIGDAAPVADVPDDTWARARRSRRRDRALALAIGAVAVALVAGFLAWLPQRSGPQPADTGRAGVPATIWSVPDGVFTDVDVETDLAVGRAAVAMLTDDGLPVVVGAADGAYHPLRLPGFGRFQAEQGVLSLSPDGRQLAWPWSGRSNGTGATATGVRIVDLETGRQRSIRLTGGDGVVVYQFVWSPDSRWVLWDGNDAGRWDARAYAAGDDSAGRIAPGASSSEQVPRTDAESTRFAIGNDGTVLIASADDQALWDHRVVETEPRPDGWYPEALTPRDGVLLEGRELDPPGEAYTADHRVVTSSGPVPAPELAQTRLVPLGLLGDETLVAQTQELDDSTTWLSLVDLTDGALRTVGEIDANGQVTVAVDLMSPDDPTVTRPEPAWLETDDGRSALTWSLLAGGALVLVAGAVGLVVVRRRRAL